MPVGHVLAPCPPIDLLGGDAEPLGEDVIHTLRLKSHLKGVIELVLGHGDQLGELGVGEIGEDRSVDIAKNLGNLANTVGSVIEEENGIVVCEELSAISEIRKNKCHGRPHP